MAKIDHELENAESGHRRSIFKRLKEFKWIIQGLAGIIVGVVANYIFEVTIRDIARVYEWAILYSAYFALLIAAVFVFIIGAGVFWLRGRYPLAYGTTEVAVGVLAAINALARASFTMVDPGVLIQIIGGVGKALIRSTVEARWRWFFQRR